MKEYFVWYSKAYPFIIRKIDFRRPQAFLVMWKPLCAFFNFLTQCKKLLKTSHYLKQKLQLHFLQHNYKKVDKVISKVFRSSLHSSPKSYYRKEDFHDYFRDNLRYIPINTKLICSFVYITEYSEKSETFDFL